MITYLTTDWQTMMDLGIQSSPYDEQLIHTLFLSTETKEGRQMMKSWIAQPLCDLESIKARQNAIAWDKLPPLPMDEEELDFLEYYLAYRDQLSPKNAVISFFNKVDRWFKYDSARYIITRGVELVIRLAKLLNKLQNQLPEKCPHLIEELKRQIQQFFLHEDMKGILSIDETSLSDFDIDHYDYQFRQEHYPSIRELLTCIYTLDVCRSARRIAIEKGLCIQPLIHTSSEWELRNFRHPLMTNAACNNWHLSKEENVSILTGSNMAGKSTTLKALTLNVWLAHCGLPVAATFMSCPIYAGIYTSINLPDSLRDGRSHFMAEVQRIKEVLSQANSGKRCLIVLDEMFRGTNAQDAYEASVAVNQLLLKYPQCHFLISTHILEYAKYFEHHPACKFYYMESHIQEDRFICTYRLKEGISESKVGYWIIRKELIETFASSNRQT